MQKLSVGPGAAASATATAVHAVGPSGLASGFQTNLAETDEQSLAQRRRADYLCAVQATGPC